MKCPIDQTEMEEGITAHSSYSGYGTVFWATKIIAAGLFDKKPENPVDIKAFRCPKCGKVELTTEVK